MTRVTSSRKPKDSSNYVVYDLQDNLVMCGSVIEICEKLDIVKSTLCKAVKNNSIVRRKWRIYYDD